MKLRPLLFVLPNLFTVSSIFCGFYVLVLCSDSADAGALHLAALITLLSNFCDTFDGRVARLTRTQSRFGMELDSLADVIAFGLAPAFLVYRWALEPLGFVGLFAAFAFVACAALRLARFNVEAHASGDGGGGSFFVGLPTPIASASLASLVIAHHHASGGEPVSAALVPWIAVATVGLAALMVSSVAYRTFKKLGMGRQGLIAASGALAFATLVAVVAHPAWVLFSFCAAYLVMGLVECTAFWTGRLTTLAGAGGTQSLLDDDAVDEDGGGQGSGGDRDARR